jgi:hypothetical protein
MVQWNCLPSPEAHHPPNKRDGAKGTILLDQITAGAIKRLFEEFNLAELEVANRARLGISLRLMMSDHKHLDRMVRGRRP